MSVLTGSASGSSRRDVVEQAEAIAVTYFGTACVDVRLHDERVSEIDVLRDGHKCVVKEVVEFAAEFGAQEHHEVGEKTFGFPQCRRCGREEGAGTRLPRAVWPDA